MNFKKKVKQSCRNTIDFHHSPSQLALNAHFVIEFEQAEGYLFQFCKNNRLHNRSPL